MRVSKGIQPSLRLLQREFAARLRGVQTSMPAWILSDSRASGEERLEIYSGAYGERLFESLNADFPATALIPDFRELVEGYLRAHPPREASLSDAGSAFSAWLARRGRRGAVRPWVAELAALEWAVLESFYAGEGEDVDLAVLGAVPGCDWARVRCELSPSVRLLKHRYAVEGLWRLRKDPVGFRKAARGVRMLRTPQRLCLWRDRRHAAFHAGVTVVSLEPAAFALLHALSKGRSLGSVCALVERAHKTTPAQIQSWFASWIVSGVISSVR